MSTEPLPEPLILEPPVKPLIPIPWNVYCCQGLTTFNGSENLQWLGVGGDRSKG